MPYFGLLRRHFFPWILALSLFCYVPSLAFADASSASLSVTVADPSGAVIPNATAILRNRDTNQEQTSASSKSGNATFTFLKPGHYSLAVSKNGFSEVTVNGILLNVGDDKHLRLVLKVGAANQSVTVDGSGITINTTDGSVSTVIDRKFVANIPLNGRSFQDLISMTPGVVTSSPQTTFQSPGKNGDFSINGQRTEANYYTIDGVSGNTNTGTGLGGTEPGQAGVVPAGSALGTTQSLLSVDALQEFRVDSSTYSAEYGRSPGGQITFLSRSGTNAFHGTAFDYLRNGYFDANDWFNDELGQPKAQIHQNDFGGTLGGPLWIPRRHNETDGTFFFFSYEGLRLSQPVAASIQYVPDTYMRAQAPPAVQAFLNAFPKPSSHGIDYGTPAAPSLAQFFQGYTVPGSIDSTSIRLDQTFTPRLRAFFRFSDTPSSVKSRTLSSLATSEINSQAYTLGTTYVISSNMTSDFRLGYTKGSSHNSSRIDDFGGSTPTELGTAMALIPTQNNHPLAEVYLSGIGSAELSTLTAANKGTQWNITDNLSYAIRHHQLKFGIDYRRITTDIINPPILAEVEWTSVPQVLSNTPSFSLLEKYLNATPTYNQFAAFAQDAWKIGSRLTLSYGIRWEVAPPPYSGNSIKPYSVLGNLSQPSTLTLSQAGASLWNTAWYSFAPRVGMAWQLHQRPGMETVIRVGSGVFFDTDNEAGLVAFQGVGYSALKEFSNVPMPFTNVQQDFSVAVAPPYSLAFYYPKHLQLPYTNEWSVAIEQGLGRDQTFALSYLGSTGRRLTQQREFSNLTPAFASIYYMQGGVTSSYNALQAKFQRQVNKGLNALISYTWSHSLDYGSNYTSLPLTYGNSDFDVRNNFQAGLNWDIPTTRSTDATSFITRGWGLDGRFLARTAFPVTLRGNKLTDPATGNIYYSNVNIVTNVPIYLDGSEYPGKRIINRAAFSLPLGTNPGNAARNFLRGFGADQINLAMHRNFSLREKVGLLFRAEAFNVLNHPNFGYVDATLSDATFGHATQTLNQSLGTVASQYQQGGPRSMQFALKVQF